MVAKTDLANQICTMIYYTYIITNPGKTVLYTGMTNNLKRRMSEHRKNKGKWKTFGGRYYCNKLVYYEEFKTRGEAIAREKEIKELNHDDKIQLVKTKNPCMDFFDVWKLI